MPYYVVQGSNDRTFWWPVLETIMSRPFRTQSLEDARDFRDEMRIAWPNVYYRVSACSDGPVQDDVVKVNWVKEGF